MNNDSIFELDSDSALQKFTSTIYDTSKQEFDPLDLGLYILKTGNFQQRWEVAKLFPKLGTRIIDPLVNILKNEANNLEFRWFIGRILEQFDDTRVIFAFVDLLQITEEEELSSMAVEALGNIGINAISNLEQLLTDNSSKLLAVKALAKIRHTKIISSLTEVVDDPNSEVRAIAIEALGSFHKRDLIPILIKALKDPIVAVRKEAIIALGMQPEFKEEFALVKQINPLLYDFDLEICQQAALALGRLKDQEASEALSNVLDSKSTPIALKKTVIKSLNWLENSQALDSLRRALWKQEENLDVIKTIITILGEQGKDYLQKQATQILIDFLESKHTIVNNNQIKQEIAVSLGELKNPIAINSLNHLAQDSEKIVQLHAIAAIKKIND